MKKMLCMSAALLLLTSCTPPDLTLGGNLPYRVWQSWEEMKEVLGDHYLYPTYMPEVTQRSEHVFRDSYYNLVPRDSSSDELFFGWSVYYHSDWRDDSISIFATDDGRKNVIWPSNNPFPVRIHSFIRESDRFNEHTVTIGGIDIEFTSFFATVPPPEWWHHTPDEWYKNHARTARAVIYVFEIDTVTYEMQWVQYDVDVEDRYDDEAQREGMLRVATSIIEQVREVE